MDAKRILLVMKNKPGVLNKISGLFQKRGINIENITAGEGYPHDTVRMTITGFWDNYTLNQVIVQAEKLFDVEFIKAFSRESVFRELVLIKIKVNSSSRQELLQILDIYRGSVVDVALESLIVEITGDIGKIDGFLKLIKNFDVLEIARTGVSAMSRGLEV
ncbi:acetolactate synthase small subunit [Cetobacterium sp.]|uniref:acetolactate synthase small subunit n=1 Tax=Cetobacterium sp. TaxID=2071632 RepID=UPI003AEF971A